MANRPQSVSEAIISVGRDFFPHFNLDEPLTKEVYQQVWYSFTGGPGAQRLKVDAAKGIMMVGSIGVGKTTLMRIMQRLFKDTPRRFMWARAVDIADLIGQYEPVELKEMYGRKKCDLYLDDIGMGRSAIAQNSWGNKVNIISEILYERYELFVTEGFKTHISSNTPTTVKKDAAPDVQSLERMYGDRVLDRLIEMENLITWQGESKRGVKYGTY